MGMTAKLYSLNALATELQRDRRTVGKALSHVAPDGKTPAGDPAWHLTTALSALGRNEDRRSHHHGGGDDSDIREVEFVSRKLHDFFERLRATDVETRRKMVDNGEGAVVGEFMRVVEQARAGHSEAVRQIEQPFIDKMHGGAIGELFRLCNWELDASR
jgi:hypothetical protein